MSAEQLEDSITLSTTGQDSRSVREPKSKVFLYFLPGNPGLIEYYREFLTAISKDPHLNNSGIQYEILGESYKGFEVRGFTHDGNKSAPYSLKEQIAIVRRRLDHHFWGKEGKEPAKVVLIGHSVGAYILLEVVAHQQAAQRTASHKAEGSNYEIIGGICLFPTIVDLAGSPRGRIASPVAKLPVFSILVHILVRTLTFLIPKWLWFTLVQKVTGMPDPAANVTTEFLRSSYGVRQALYMARNELYEMTHDKWDDDLWSGPAGSSASGQNGSASRPRIDRPKLYFYWGEYDYWIDNSTRDRIIATRGQGSGVNDERGKPHMEIDPNGIPHDFCIRDSNPIAQKVAQYVNEIVKSNGV